MDALQYTRSELEKELVLLEKHLKQYPYMKQDFCIDCALKHFTAIEGLSEEGVGFAKSEEEKKFFIRVADWAKKWRSNLPKSDEEAVRAAEEARTMRKDVILSPLLGFLSVSEVKSQPSKSEDLVLDFLATKGPKTFNELRELKLGDVELNRALMKLKRSGLVSFKRVEGIGTLWSISSSSNPNPGPIEKPINLFNILGGEEKSMPAMSGLEAASITLSGLAGKLADRGLIELDKYYGKELLPVEQRYRTWGSLAGGALAQLGSFFGLKKWAAAGPESRKAIQLGIYNIGSTLFTDVVDVAEELIMTPAAAGLAPAGAAAGRVVVSGAVRRGSYT
jgi:predicted transcriptional regulator